MFVWGKGEVIFTRRVEDAMLVWGRSEVIFHAELR